jgi:hypothetical protein
MSKNKENTQQEPVKIEQPVRIDTSGSGYFEKSKKDDLQK